MILLADKKKQPNSFNVSAIRQAVADVIGVKGNGGKSSIVTHIGPFLTQRFDRFPRHQPVRRSDLAPASPSGFSKSLQHGPIT